MIRLRGGPMDGHAVRPEEVTGLVVVIKEFPGLNTGELTWQVARIAPTTPVPSLDGRLGIYEPREDGDYHWHGWVDA